MEVESKLAFFDILLHRDGHGIITTVYKKVTNNDVYLKLVFLLSKRMEARNFNIFDSTSLCHLFIITFTERKVKTI